MKMGKKVKEYKSGDFIFAKVKGYPAWPARVQKQNGKKYLVYFYGTGETANLPPNMIFEYSENKDKFLNKSVKRKDFNDGVKQIEHDFTNNVPLEQVIGASADAEPPAADDSMNDTANDTADDSAVGDTTVDDNMDETANSADGPLDSDDAGALVIDEGKKGRKSSAKAPATPKAKDPKTPRGRPKKEEVKDAKEVKEDEDEKKEEEVVSRSGRKIKPGKRYIDEQTEENATLPSPAPKKRRGASPSADKDKETKEKPQDKNIRAYNTVQQSELRELKEPFKSADPEKENILVTYLPSGQYCGVKLFQSRPASFKNDASRLQWEKQAASNAITLKRQLEKGQITPQSISAQLVTDLNLTDEEKQALDRDRDLEVRKSRLHFLKTEMKLIELDAKIKTCLSLEKADTDLCLKLIDEILELDLAALMLLKHPTCMETVKRMRVYVGNTPSWEMSESEALTFSKQAHRIRNKADTLFITMRKTTFPGDASKLTFSKQARRIRNKADALFITMRDLFHVPDGVSFSEMFNERVAQFKAATENLHADKLLEMVHEPIELSQPSALTMKAAVDAANANNDEEVAEADDADKKKKATPAKGKKEKANSTPLKQPLKRQSRKQQLEEKEKEKETAQEKSEEPDTKKPNNTGKKDTEPKENSDETDKSNDAVKPAGNETDEADKEVEKVNDNSKKNEKEADEKADSEKNDEVNNESNSKEVENKTNDIEEDKDSEVKDSKKKESDSDKSKDNGKSKDKESKDKESKDKESKDKESKDKASDKKDEVKNGKDKTAKPGDKRKEKGDKEKLVEKEKVDDEPRAKRSRESKKTEPPPRSPAKRKSRS